MYQMQNVLKVTFPSLNEWTPALEALSFVLFFCSYADTVNTHTQTYMCICMYNIETHLHIYIESHMNSDTARFLTSFTPTLLDFRVNSVVTMVKCSKPVQQRERKYQVRLLK